MTSVKQAVAISKGEMEPSRVFHVNPDGILSCSKKSEHTESDLYQTKASDQRKNNFNGYGG